MNILFLKYSDLSFLFEFRHSVTSIHYNNFVLNNSSTTDQLLLSNIYDYSFYCEYYLKLALID